MYKVLIADDNGITRDSIMLTINWNKLDCETIAGAENGVVALEYTKKYMPDIIITDIRMPGMDGLKFIEKVKISYPWIKVIIITGYNEFKYAQEAIRLGAFDLVLKPIDNNEIYNIIKKAVNILNEEKKEKTKREFIESTIRKSKDQVKAKMLIDIIEGIETPENYKSMQLQRKFFIFSICYKISCKEIGDQVFQHIIEQTRQTIETLKINFDYDYTGFWLNNNFTIFVLETGKSSLGRLGNDLVKICNNFSTIHILSIDYVVGVSHVFSQFNEIKKAYNQSLDALDLIYFYCNKNIIYSDLLKARYELNEYTLLKSVYDSIKDMDIDRFDKAIDGMREKLIAETPTTLSVKNLLSNICTIAMNFCLNKRGNQFNDYKGHTEINTEIFAIDNIETAITYVKNYVGKLIAYTDNESKICYSKVTMQVIDYLNEHYDKKISLQEISDFVSLTPSHLSRVIKKDTGKSFVDLFNKIKISAAEKLLRESNLKVYEVANRIGIDNYSYFYQLFKKNTGIAPTEYYNKGQPV